MNSDTSLQNDVQAIEQLHAKDMLASKTGDFAKATGRKMESPLHDLER